MKKRMAYIAVKSCGCVVGAVVDCPETDSFRDEAIADWKADGLTIEYVDSVRGKDVTICRCDEKQQKLALR